jgi:hypothetical protein
VKEESKKTGLIYEVSRLTIAAAGAADSTEGCFLWEKYPSPIISIPYYSSTSEDSSISLESILINYGSAV